MKEVSDLKTCQNSAHYRYTWPGKGESFICQIHAMKLIEVAEAIGLPLQLIRLSPEEISKRHCSQLIK